MLRRLLRLPAACAAVAAVVLVLAASPVSAHEGHGTDTAPATVTVTPAPSDPRCAGTVVSGSTVTLVADGFAPLSEVTVTASPAFSDQRTPGRVQADGDGGVSVSVVVPFDQPVAAVAFTVAAAGTADDGHPVVRTATLSWQPAGSLCAASPSADGADAADRRPAQWASVMALVALTLAVAAVASRRRRTLDDDADVG